MSTHGHRVGNVSILTLVFVGGDLAGVGVNTGVTSRGVVLSRLRGRLIMGGAR